MSIHALRKELDALTNQEKAVFLQRFFKTGKGEYGEGDQFLGLTVPESRKIAVKYKDLPFFETGKLLVSKIHEYRLIALLILVNNFKTGDETGQKEIYKFYLDHTKYINNWDLVDLSADKIVGAYLLHRPRKILYTLARSQNLWERRIAMISTYQFIKEKKEYKDTFQIAEILLLDKHDLIQKAVGWMLREVGKRASKEALVKFLSKNYKQMPRTMLRYSIEHFPQKQRLKYIKGEL